MPVVGEQVAAGLLRRDRIVPHRGQLADESSRQHGISLPEGHPQEMVLGRDQVWVECERALERAAQIGVSSAEQRPGMREVLAQRPPCWPVAGKALRNRLHAVM